VTVIKPNVAELFAMAKALLDQEVIKSSFVQQSVTEYLESKSRKWSMNDVRVVATAVLEAMQAKSSVPTKGALQPGVSAVNGKHVIVSLGELGVLWVGPSKVLGASADTEINDLVSSRHIAADRIPHHEIVNTSGAGDTFCAGFINSLLLNNGEKGARGVGGPTVDDVMEGIAYSGKAIRSASTVPIKK
jgi:sugar/nucleoside kinase (ribokinase family)